MLTIAIPSYQRRDHLDRLLGSIEHEVVAAGEPLVPVEVLVVLDGSTDGSLALIESRATEFPVPLRAVWQENAGPAAARNRCADEALGELIWYLDDDMTISGAALAHHLAWDRSETPMLMGPCVIRSDDPSAATARQWYGERWARLQAVTRLTDPIDITFANASMPTSLIREHRFVERFRGYGSEDVELAIRLVEAGVTVGYSPEAHVEHDFTPSAEERLRKLREEGRNRMLLVELHPGYASVAFSTDVGRFERMVRSISRRGYPARTLWPLAQLLSAASRVVRDGGTFTRLQTLSETASLYAGVADVLRSPNGSASG